MATAASPTDDVIVWEFESDKASIFLPYEDCVSNSLEKNYAKNNKCKRCKLNSQMLKDKTVDFSKMKQISSHGGLRSIRRQIYKNSYHIAKGVSWMWLTDNGWVSYDVNTIQVIEDANVQGNTQVDLENQKIGIPNVVHITGSFQKNKYTGFMRPIKRLNVSYVTTSGKVNQQSTNNSQDTSTQNTDNDEDDDVFEKYKSFCERFSQTKHQQTTTENEPCPICLYELDDTTEVAVLSKCQHQIHIECLKSFINHQSKASKISFLQCPKCKVINGVKMGDQPLGTMDVTFDRRNSVGGYPRCGTIRIIYNFLPGIQSAEHPNPGSRYHTSSFPRTGYLPDNKEGQKVLKMLKIAFDRRLTFTIGQSVTTGQHDCVVWNEIHHKTSAYDNYSGHGYPDPNYLDNVTDELKQHGITEADLT